MINTIKWVIYYRCDRDTDRAKNIYNAICKKLEVDTWGEEWTKEQEDLFYEAIDLLLPQTTKSIQDVYALVQEVFGDFTIKDKEESGHT
jgi:hypothetical protein